MFHQKQWLRKQPLPIWERLDPYLFLGGIVVVLILLKIGMRYMH